MNSDDLVKVLDKIITILSESDETNWLNVLKKFRKRCDFQDKDNKQTLLSDMMGIFGGMGSFSDLVLYKNGELLIEKTTHLDDLRKDMHKILLQNRSQTL